MATINLFLDGRRPKCDGTAQVKLSVTVDRVVKYVPTGVYVPVDMWDAKARVALPAWPQSRRANNLLERYRLDADDVLLSRRHWVSAQELYDAVCMALFPEAKRRADERRSLGRAFERFVALKSGKTREQYECCRRRLELFCGDLGRVLLDDVSKGWLSEWDAWMRESGASPNTRADYLICLRAVFNYAIDEGLTQNYPFRRFRVKKVATPKRSLSVEDLRWLFDVKVEDWQRQYLDFFKLTFFLMGINSVDLLRLTNENMHSGRIQFNRAKTGRLYSMKVEPEAMEIIERYRGKDHLIDPMDRYGSYEDYRHRVNDALRKIGPVVVGKHGKKVREPLFPQITTYWARHTWATIAATLDIPKDTIAAALGHGGNTVTDIYIDFDRRKVDEANRRVIDWVLYGKG